CTGEGGISRHHLHGGDLIWQIGTGYFGCRDEHGRFDAEAFAEQAAHDAVKMIEIKLSQGAKPGHGGILPAEKITPEIAEIRKVPFGQDVISPPAHSAFGTPRELVRWLDSLRMLSGKPVGIKLCVGEQHEFLAICRAMLETGCHPDYIAVDGSEGGTGAAPAEFSNSLGSPLVDGLLFVHGALVAAGLRDRIRIAASGKIATGFGMVRMIALGADFCYSARAMMLALGCIQARHCNNNRCPVGVATQDPRLTVGLDVKHKQERVRRYQQRTVRAALELIAAAGLGHPSELTPRHILRRLAAGGIASYEELRESIEPGCLRAGRLPSSLRGSWEAASSETFAAQKTYAPSAMLLPVDM
ncbi:MAG: FMN-binding glutamate synthase family protein, partial [Myxococcales bacterium]|nr:FMN-binding glutamate synthase family protein [Myxococcales bacterium]